MRKLVVGLLVLNAVPIAWLLRELAIQNRARIALWLIRKFKVDPPPGDDCLARVKRWADTKPN